MRVMFICSCIVITIQIMPIMNRMHVNVCQIVVVYVRRKYNAALEFKGFSENDHRSLVFT